MLSVALLGYAGFAALCLAMDKHFKELLKHTPRAVHLRSLRWAGWGLLLASLVLAVHLRGLAFGLVEWMALLMAAVTLWVFILPYRPRWLLGLAAISLVLGPLLGLASLIR
ncbi:DUF3325 domain-containing protein [Pseudomonas cremoricolorata]|uniref:Membrane protein n=1 Tax=Pseudomonas cremoricolorata TaxID=157783 RepID=A0A089WJT6_9PSED|nr:DUF3325 domain-containing protein [Pseudomonas cremoricolorata]AIR89560.1 membrane protein [Pseudomonas cremoricolorata]